MSTQNDSLNDAETDNENENECIATVFCITQATQQYYAQDCVSFTVMCSSIDERFEFDVPLDELKFQVGDRIKITWSKC